MTVSAYVCRHRARPCDGDDSSATTRLRGTLAAESAVLGEPGSSAEWPYTSGPKVTVPLNARAYGSSSSLAGLQRTPRAGSYGPAARYP